MTGMTDEDRKRQGNRGRERSHIAARWWPITQSEPRCGVSESTTRRFIAEGLVEARKVGSRVLINDESMDRCIAAQPPAVIKPDDRSAKLANRAA